MLRVTAHEGTQREAEAEAEVFCRLVAPAMDASYQLAGYLLGNSADAQDAAQDAVVKAWTSFGSLHDRALFDRWFRRILVNVCRDRLRRRHRVRWVPLGDPADDPEAGDPFALSLVRDAVGRALEACSPDERAVVVLHYWNDMSTADIAATLGVPQGTVKFRLHTAYAALRHRLEAASKEAGR